MFFFLFQDNEYTATQNQLEVLEGDSFRSYFDENIQSIFEREDIDGMITYVIKALEEERIDMFICHSMAHDIGHYGGYVENFSNIELYLSKRNLDFCGSGFMHGIEGEVANHLYPENVDNLLAVCNLIKPFNPYYNGCYHGAGHAFMENTRDLEEALAQCNLLHTTEDIPPEDCYRGVYSQNVIFLSQEGITGFALMDMCAAQTPKFQYTCAQELNGFELPREATQDDVAQVVSLCLQDQYPEDIQRGCLQSVAGVAMDRLLGQKKSLLFPEILAQAPESHQYKFVQSAHGAYIKTAAIQQQNNHFNDFCMSIPDHDLVKHCIDISQS